MEENPLDKFRRRTFESPSLPTGNVPTYPGTTQYEAFKVVNKRQTRLKVRPFMRAWERVTYAYLLRIVEDGIYGTEIALVFTFCVIVIRGRNLQPLAEALDAECCEFIQQFDPTQWKMPTDKNAPFIENITIHVQTMVEASDKALADIEATRRNPPMR